MAFTNTVADGEKLIALAKAKGLVLSAFHNRRCDGYFLTVRKLLDSGRLGDVRLAEFRWDRFRPEVTQLWRDRPEAEFDNEFEEAALVTLGMCYQQTGRFSGSAYHSVLRRCDRFLRRKLPDALMERRLRADKLLELNDLVNEAVASLKAKGMESPYLKAFVVARINPLRFTRKPADFDETIDKMIASARKFDAGRIRSDQVARTGGPPPAED